MAFTIDVKLFAIRLKREGKSWGEIQQSIKERFGPKILPTVRSLQLWEKETEQGLFDKEIKEKAKKEAETAKNQAITQVAEELLPRLWKARDAGEDIEYEGWRWFFSIVENALGSEKARKYMQKYLEEPSRNAPGTPTPELHKATI